MLTFRSLLLGFFVVQNPTSRFGGCLKSLLLECGRPRPQQCTMSNRPDFSNDSRSVTLLRPMTGALRPNLVSRQSEFSNRHLVRAGKLSESEAAFEDHFRRDYHEENRTDHCVQSEEGDVDPIQTSTSRDPML